MHCAAQFDDPGDAKVTEKVAQMRFRQRALNGDCQPLYDSVRFCESMCLRASLLQRIMLFNHLCLHVARDTA